MTTPGTATDFAATSSPLWIRILRGAASFALWVAIVTAISAAEQRTGMRGPLLMMFNAAFAVAVYLGCARFIERRIANEFTLPAAGLEWLSGFGIGIGIFALTIGIFAAAGWYRPLGVTWSLQILVSGFALCLGTAVAEEILVRGYIFRFLQTGLGTWAALALSALAFGLLHMGNPNATLWSSFAIAVEAGILLGAAYVLTGRLWLAIGIHTSWNFAEGTLFGTRVSGIDFPSITQARVSGPALLTGSSFGPEASLITVAVCLALSAVFIARIVRTQNIQPPMWQVQQPAAAVST